MPNKIGSLVLVNARVTLNVPRHFVFFINKSARVILRGPHRNIVLFLFKNPFPCANTPNDFNVMYFSGQFLKLGWLYRLDKDLTHSQLNLDLCNIFLNEWTGVIVKQVFFLL